MNVSSRNEELIEAVTYHRVGEVKRLLELGANPNYDSCYGKSIAEKTGQPYTPLRMVMFCISDSLLNDEGLRDFAEIARLLIQYGAHTGPAMEIAELRYGKYDSTGERNLFLQVWDIIAVADMHNGA